MVSTCPYNNLKISTNLLPRLLALYYANVNMCVLEYMITDVLRPRTDAQKPEHATNSRSILCIHSHYIYIYISFFEF